VQEYHVDIDLNKTYPETTQQNTTSKHEMTLNNNNSLSTKQWCHVEAFCSCNCYMSH